MPGDGGGPTTGDKPPGEFLTVVKEGKTQHQFEQALYAAEKDGYELQVAVFYKEEKPKGKGTSAGG